jgi:uncharacterized protein (DUF58 family)
MSDLFTPAFFVKLQQLKIYTRRSYLGSRQGAHISKRRGHGLEFADYRTYVAGDDYRHIDWGVYGRTDRLYIKEFREEQELQTLFLVDSSASMGCPESKFATARDLAISLAYVALSNGDSAAFSFLGHQTTPKFFGVRSLSRIIRQAGTVVPGGRHTLDREITLSLGKIRLPGKAFLVSDMLMPLDEVVKACEAVQSKNFELSIIQVMSPDELKLDADDRSTSVLVDVESGEQLEMSLSPDLDFDYAKKLSDHLHQIERYCHSRGIGYALVSTAQRVQEIVLNTLPELGLLR